MLINVVCLQGDRFSDTLLAGLTFSVFTLYKSMSLCQRQTAGFDGEFIFCWLLMIYQILLKLLF